MSFFGTLSAGNDFAPLFRFLDDYDAHRSSRAGSVQNNNNNNKCQGKCEGQCQGKCQGNKSKCNCTGRSSSLMKSFSPRFDVRESNTSYHLDGELPGTQQSNIDIEFTEPQTLTIKGHTEREYSTSTPPESTSTPEDNNADEQQTDDYKYHAVERSVGQFRRVFSFPMLVDQDNVKASLHNGILTVVAPKVPKGTKKITVE